MGAAWSEEGVFKLTFPFTRREEALRALEPEPDWIEDERGFEKLAEKVRRYFEGRRISFEDIPVSFELGTEFQKKVWSITREIPYGERRTYKEIACMLGIPRGCRAVAQALKRNPLFLLVPCHRVVGAGGRLVGFSGGLELKRKLLDLEAGSSPL